MEPVEQIILGLIIVLVEFVLISVFLLGGLRAHWKDLDNDPVEIEEAG